MHSAGTSCTWTLTAWAAALALPVREGDRAQEGWAAVGSLWEREAPGHWPCDPGGLALPLCPGSCHWVSPRPPFLEVELVFSITSSDEDVTPKEDD